MESKMNKMIAVAVVVILVVVAAAVLIMNGGNDNGSDADTVTITQNDGTKVEVAVPVEKICIVNTNAAEFASILGVSDRVVGVSNSMKKTPTESWWAERKDIGKYNTPSAEAILETGATVVVGQCTSMPITNVEALQSQGITVILLDMYGYDVQVDDVKQFAKLFPDTDAKKIADKYADFFNGIVSKIKSKTSAVNDADKKTFISTMGTKADSKYYTTAAEMSKMFEEICGMKNAAGNLIPSPSSSSMNIGEDAIVKEFNTNGIDMFILRNSTSYDDAKADIESFLDSHQIIKSEGMFDKMDVYKTVDSKVMSGPRCFVGMVYFASVANPNLDLGMTVDSVIADYNEQFGTSWSAEKLFYIY